MKIIKITCVDSNKCHVDIKVKYPDVIAVSHIPNNHIVTMSTDYDDKENLKDEIHELCWILGGVKKESILKGERVIVKPPLIEKNKLFSKLKSMTDETL